MQVRPIANGKKKLFPESQKCYIIRINIKDNDDFFFFVRMSREEHCLLAKKKNTLDRIMMKNEADSLISELPPDNYPLPQTTL